MGHPARNGWGTQHPENVVLLCLLWAQQQAAAAAVGIARIDFLRGDEAVAKAKAGEGKDFAMTCSSAPTSAMQSM